MQHDNLQSLLPLEPVLPDAFVPSVHALHPPVQTLTPAWPMLPPPQRTVHPANYHDYRQPHPSSNTPAHEHDVHSTWQPATDIPHPSRNPQTSRHDLPALSLRPSPGVRSGLALSNVHCVKQCRAVTSENAIRRTLQPTQVKQDPQPVNVFTSPPPDAHSDDTRDTTGSRSILDDDAEDELRNDSCAQNEGDETSGGNPYTCAHCAARFPSRERRKDHIRTVHAKPFSCSVCHARFTRKFDLEKHSLTVHEGMRPYRCEQCSTSFGQKHHLVRHRRSVHFKKRDFECGLCDSRFARKEHLENHQRAIHDRFKPYMCSLCDVQYCEKRALRRHLEQVHSVKSSRSAALAAWQPNGKSPPPSIVDLLDM